MSDEVRIGSLRLKFLIDDADNGGKLTMFDMNVPEQAKVPAAHYHRDFEEVWYGLGGVLTVTLDGVAHLLKSGDALFVPRGAVHRFDNLRCGRRPRAHDTDACGRGEAIFRRHRSCHERWRTSGHDEGERGHGKVRADCSVRCRRARHSDGQNRILSRIHQSPTPCSIRSVPLA